MIEGSVQPLPVTRIVSFLGTTNYDLAGYALRGDNTKVLLSSLNDTAAIYDAIENGELVELVVVGTEQVASIWMPHFERVLGEASLEELTDLRERRATRAQRPIAEYLDDGRLRWAFVRVPQGRALAESWMLFSAIRRLAKGDALDLDWLQQEIDAGAPAGEPLTSARPLGVRRLGEATRIHVDITNGFRSQPFFASSALAHLVTNEGREDGRPRSVGYSVYAIDNNRYERGPLGTTAPRAPENPEPVQSQDVSRTLEAFRWTAAVHALMLYGRADELKEMVSAYAAEHAEDAATAREFGDAAREFADSLCTIRLPKLVSEAAPRLGRASSSFRALIAERLPPLTDPLRELGEWAEKVSASKLISDEGLGAAMRVIDLCLELHRYAEAVAVMRETLITLWSLERRRAVALDDDDFTEVRRRQERNLGGISQSTGLIVESNRKARLSPRAVVGLYERVSRVRNDVLHAGFRSKAPDASWILHQVRIQRNELATLIEKRCRPAPAAQRKERT